MITVIDLKIGNIDSVSRALRYLGTAHNVSNDIEDVSNADKLIFPGVGNFSEASKRLKLTGLDRLLRYRVLEDNIPILGICLGMQLFATYGEEGGVTEGLDFIKGKVTYHRASEKGLRLPHIGWNEVHYENFKLFDSIHNDSCFYFVHSYEMIISDSVKIAYSNYGVEFIAAVQKNNIIGVQFHPEKSQQVGFKLLENFCRGTI